jgi:hypothetical protein
VPFASWLVDNLPKGVQKKRKTEDSTGKEKAIFAWDLLFFNVLF